jgi:hypothetical protein
LEDGRRISKGGILRLADLASRTLGEGRLGGEIDGRTIQKHDTLGTDVARRNQANPARKWLSRNITTGARLKDQQGEKE